MNVFFDKKNNRISTTGFTIIELLVVIGIISILASIVIIIIAPAEKMKSAREATRAAHFNAIGSSFHLAVTRDNGFDNIAGVLEEPDCNGDDGDGSTTIDWNIERDFTDDCAELIGLGFAPLDPEEGEGYKVKGTSGEIAGRLIIYTTATESKWQEENPLIY